MKNKQRWRQITGLLVLTAGLFAAFLGSAGHFLVVEEKPKKADVIVVLSPGIERIQAGADLWHTGYADYLMLSKANTGTFTVQQAIEFGVSPEQIIAEEQAHSTYTNATYTLEMMQEKNLKSAIVVTSDYHVRRTKFVFNKVFQGSDIDLSYSSVPSPFTFTAWWTDEASKRMLWKEYAKLAGYYILY